jgi:galactose mutarotase-like enzyme
MVCCSLLYEGEELLALRGGPAAYADRGSTFGIPLLHPWANRLSGWSYDAAGEQVDLEPASKTIHRDPDTGLPIHGLLGPSRDWTLASAGPQSVCAELDFGAHPELMAGFPFAHSLRYTARVDSLRLSIRLTLTATGSRPVPVAFGFHPYLTLPGSDRGSWRIELPVRRRALLDHRGLPTGEVEEIDAGALDGPLGERTFDDSFDELRSSTFAVEDGRRRIELEFIDGYTVAQVYAPDASPFICFEPMTAPVDALRSGRELRCTDPGESFSAEFAIVVKPAQPPLGGSERA